MRRVSPTSIERLHRRRDLEASLYHEEVDQIKHNSLGLTILQLHSQAIILSVAMASHLLLDNAQSLPTRIDRKAHDLFKAKPGKAPLQVTRVFQRKIDGDSGKTKSCYVKNQDVWDTPQIAGLKNVRIRLLASDPLDFTSLALHQCS